MSRTLAEWLDYQLVTHPQAIAMGLERVREVAQRLDIGRPGKFVVTVAGTNGKGSTVAFVEAIARAAGLRVGAFTSPHLLRYNERVRVDGHDVDDATLVAAFERIEAARLREPMQPLTYFEFGTLAALWVFAEAGLDLAILEVGLGGRLDAVNIVDADVAVITTVDVDHQDYLGNDREAIGAEKAGILRAGKPCVLAEKDPPSSVLRRAYALGAYAIRGHSDYLIDTGIEVQGGPGWRWREPGHSIELPMPYLSAPAQLDNAAAAIAALRALPLKINRPAIARGVADARVAGRLQVIEQSPQVVLDVGHNPQAARQLAAWLQAHPRRTRAVFSALGDKDLDGITAPLIGLISHWHLAGLEGLSPRGLAVSALAAQLPASVREHGSAHETVAAALASARQAAAADERILVFGSFFTVAAALGAA